MDRNPSAATFMSRLRSRWQVASPLCVGLDPDPRRMPASLEPGRNQVERTYAFCRRIVDATAEHVCCFKPQIAYFAAIGAEAALEELIRHIHTAHPGIPVILDAKRGDIGPTARQYAIEAFERYGADALTLSPYMGFDSIEPYFDWPDRGLFLLCRTSNPGGADLQALQVDGMPLYAKVAGLASSRWNRHGNLGLVVGATFPRELKHVRDIAPTLPLLVPGIGAQGGDIDATLRAGPDAQGQGLIINSSRAILYAGEGEDFDAAARRAAHATRTALEAAGNKETAPALQRV